MTSNPVDVKVDWFAYTVPLVSGTDDQSPDTIAFMLKSANSFVLGCLDGIMETSKWELTNRGGFYSVMLTDTVSSARLSWGKTNNHVYVELPGKACEFLRDRINLNDLIQQAASRCSRIDIAGDWLSDLEPRDVIGDDYATGRKSFSQIRSNEGLTVYVGSRKSDRFMRVYRYRKPHPRNHLLRFEHENKGQIAKSTCISILESGLQETFSFLQNGYHWDLLEINRLSTCEGKIASNRNRSDEVHTLLWIIDTVAPALAAAARKGLINLDEFIELHVKPRIT